MDKTKHFLIFILFSSVFFVSFFVYLKTLSPTVYLEDSGELITAAVNLGIPHPSGYPLYVILGKVFSLLPFGSAGWKINLMSAFFGVLTVCFLFLIIFKLTKSALAAFTASLILAFSHTFWSQSVIAEVYTLNSFFVVLLFFLILKWQEKRQWSYLYYFSFLYGLSLTNHQMNILLLPVFFMFVLTADWKILTRFKEVVLIILLFGFGLLVYVYLPWRSLQNPVLDWGNPENLNNFLAHVLRRQYNDLSIAGQSINKLPFFLIFLYQIISDFSFPFVILSLTGLGFLFLKQRRLAFLSVGIFLFNSLGIILLRKMSWGVGADYVYRVYFLPSYIMVSIWFSFCLQILFEKLKKFNGKWNLFTKPVLIIFLLLLPFTYLKANYNSNNRSDFYLNYDYGRKLLDSLDFNSILFVSGSGNVASDSQIFTLLYLQFVENFRRDVSVVDEMNFFKSKVAITLPPEHFKLDLEQRKKTLVDFLWSSAQANNVSLYTTFPLNQNLSSSNLASRSNGFVHKIYESQAAAKSAQISSSDLTLRNIDDEFVKNDFSASTFAALYYYSLSAYYMERSDKKNSQQYLLAAINNDEKPFSQNYSDFILHRQEWLKN